LTEIPQEIINALPRGFKYGLTGSRFFDCASPNSDWDIYAKHEQSLVTALRGAGGELNDDLKDKKYPDKNTRFTYNLSLPGFEVNVILVESFSMRAYLDDYVKGFNPRLFKDFKRDHGRLALSAMIEFIYLTLEPSHVETDSVTQVSPVAQGILGTLNLNEVELPF